MEARGRAALALTVLAVTASAGCGAGDERAAGASSSIEVAGETRNFQLYRPDGADGTPAVVVVLHPLGGNARQAERSYGWNEVADAEGFLVVYPDGRDSSWNAGGGCCGTAAEEDVDDVGFLTVLIETLLEDEDVDPNRVYVTGMSNGGMLSYALACDTDSVAAIAPVAATMLPDCPNPAPVSVLHVHGTADRVVHFDGGLASDAGEVDTPSVSAVVEHWRTVGDCTAPTGTTVGTVQHSTASCAEGREVHLTTVGGLGHEWPGSDQEAGAASPFDATEAIWRFFEANPRP